MQVLLTGFEDCGNIGSGFKLIYSLGEMLERDFIQSDLEAKHLEVPHRPPAAHARNRRMDVKALSNTPTALVPSNSLPMSSSCTSL